MAHHSDARDAHAPNVTLYMMVFAALMILTVVTVWISKFHLEVHQAVALGLLVAGVKAGLVAAVFMHLWGEKKLIFWALGVTAFFAALLVLDIADSRMTSAARLNPVNVKLQQPEAHDAHAPAPESPMGKKAPKGKH